MNTNKNFEEIMKELLREENKLIMDKYEESINEIDTTQSAGIDENIIKMVLEYDKKQKAKKKKRIVSIISKAAVFVIVCVVATNFIFPEQVQAFRTKVMDLFFNEDAGSVSIRGETELDLIGDWTNYYYPEYIPEGYKLIGAEQMGDRSIMVFVLEDEEHQIKFEVMPANCTLSLDTDWTSVEDVTISYYEGIYAENEEYDIRVITWVNEEKILLMQGDDSIDKDEYINMAESVKHIDR